MNRSRNCLLRTTAYLAIGTTAWSFSGVLASADDGKTSDTGAAIAAPLGGSSITFGQVGTAASSNLKGAAALAEGIGKADYFESLSAINLQKAIHSHLENNKERIEAYYEARDYRDARVAANRPEINEEIAARRAKDAAPERLTSQHYDSKSGKIFWPDPLDDKVLAPYTKLINEKFAKRSDPGQTYRGGDARMVQRMIALMQKSVDSIKHELPSREYVALTNYLNSIGYDAYFDAAGNRVINDE